MSREMKDSRVEWIGDIPKHWNRMMFPQVFEQVKNKNKKVQETNLLSLSYGSIIQKDIKTRDGLLPENFEGYNIIKKGDIVLRLTDLQNDHTSLRVGLNTQNGIITSAYVTIRNKIKMNEKYLYYFLHSFDICKGFYGMGAGVRQGLNFNGLKVLDIIIPYEKEQVEIVSFIDFKVSQIDSIIEKTKSTIKDYKLLKQSIITEAVTKGLNKNVEMKDSGIEWNRHIPKQWEVISGKRLFSERKERARSNDEQLTASQKFGIISQTAFMERENQKVVLVEKNFSILKHVEPNDFVISMRSFQGGLEYSAIRGCISSAYVMVIPNEKVYAPFYRWLFKSVKYINALQATSNLIRDGQALRYSNFIQVPLFTIPIKEQQEIAQYLDKLCPEFDRLISQKENLINELQHYKKSLIYEYVTGKKEVI